MNTILKDQNTIDSINLLKAQRVAYSNAKKIQLGFELIAVIVALTLPIFYIFLSEYKMLVGSIATGLSILALFIDRFQKKVTKTGASIQETFDRSVFKLPETKYSGVEKVSIEKILSLANKYDKNDLKNWYSKSITQETPHNIAVVICQKSNLHWDVGLRKKYRNFLWAITIIYFLLFITTIEREFSKTDTFFLELLFLILGSAAFIKYVFTTIFEKEDIIKEKKDLNLKLDELIKNYKSNGSEPDINQLSEIQTVIFNTRRKGVKVPDWFYEFYKKKQEKEMNKTAKAIVKSINN